MSSGMLRYVALVRSDVSQERFAFNLRVTIGELGTLAVTSNLCTLRIVFLCSVVQLTVTANVVPSSLILVTLMMVDCYKSHTASHPRRRHSS
jgi:hypothetical protein